MVFVIFLCMFFVCLVLFWHLDIIFKNYFMKSSLLPRAGSWACLSVGFTADIQQRNVRITIVVWARPWDLLLYTTLKGIIIFKAADTFVCWVSLGGAYFLDVLVIFVEQVGRKLWGIQNIKNQPWPCHLSMLQWRAEHRGCAMPMCLFSHLPLQGKQHVSGFTGTLFLLVVFTQCVLGGVVSGAFFFLFFLFKAHVALTWSV